MTEDRGLAGRVGLLAYGLVAYAVGMAALAWLVMSLAGVWPLGAGPLSVQSTAAGVAVNVGLMVLFGLQHSAMARRRFKAWWTRLIPRAAERSTYVLASGLALGALVWLWQPVEATVWSVSSPALRTGLWVLFAFGWLYLCASTFATNHWDLFGIRQVWLHMREEPYEPIPFVRKWMYRYSRHPMMAGILIGLWAVPDMGVGKLILSAGLSAYVFIGIGFEQRALRRHFGDTYRQYEREVGAFFPRLRRLGVS